MTKFGYYVFGKDMNNVNLISLKKHGVTDIFLNYYAFTAHGESKVLAWIKKANSNKINVHIWMQCFYDGEWHNPKTTNLVNKRKEAIRYANLNGVKGVHLDYLRYPGNAYKTDGGAEAITNFVKLVRRENPNTFLSCAVMPESQSKYYYGQDIEALGKIVDAVIPMQYKGNYNAGTDWLKTTTANFSKKATIFPALQSYKSDDNPTVLSSNELLNDAKTCISNGAKGVIIFRYGLSPDLNFTSLSPKKDDTMTKKKAISKKNIYNVAKKVKTYVGENKKLPSSVTVDNVKYTWPEVWYILSWAVNHLNKDLTSIPTITACKNPAGDTIKEDIKPDDFKKQASNIIKFITDNKGKCPNYVTTIKSKKRVRPRVSIDALARIIVWYYDHKNTLPNYCTYDSSRFKSSGSKTKSKYGHATKSGCNNMGQNNGVYCGPHSLQECIRNLTGKVISQATLASWAGTGSGGTDHQGLETAVAKAAKELGVKLTCKWYSFSELGWNGIKKILASQNQDCVIHNLYRYKPGVYGGDGHYEVVNAVNDSNINVQNSLGNRSCNDCYCGYIEYRSKSDFETYISGISQKSVLVITRG